jgi:hypothetical protein
MPVVIHYYTEWGVRECAASSLVQLVTKLKDIRAMAPLRNALKDKDSYVQRIAFIALCKVSAQIQDTSVVEDLIQAEPRIEGSSADLLELLKGMEPKLESKLFFSVLRCIGIDEKLVEFATKILIKNSQIKNLIEFTEQAIGRKNMEENIRVILREIKTVNSQSVLGIFILILQQGNPQMRLWAADELKSYPDAETIDALLKWRDYLDTIYAKESPCCTSCGRDPSQRLKNGDYWCSWCGKSFAFTIEDAYLQHERKEGKRD